MNEIRFTAIHVEDVTGTSLDRNSPGAELVSASVFRILASNMLCSMATVTPQGHPHINTAYFSYSDSLQLFFLSHPGSVHCQNLAREPSLAMTVFSSAQQWTNPDEGIQLFGICEEARGSLIDEAERSYANRFQAYASWKGALKGDDSARQYRFYLFRVAAVKLLDERSFGDAVFVRASINREF